MILKNTVVTFTVTIPSIEVEKEWGIDAARTKLRVAARLAIENGDCGADDFQIKDCPDYPALCD